MNENNQILTLRDNAKSELLKIKSVEDGITYLNKLKSIEIWVKAEKKDAELQNIVAEQKIRTQRVLGELISDGQINGTIASRGKPKQNVEGYDINPKTLAELGIESRDSAATWQQIASIPEEKFENYIQEKKQKVNDAVQELTTTGVLQLTKNVHVSNNSGENEWYTPTNIIESARKTLGNIDLDPASSELANKSIKADLFFTEKENGLNQEWRGNVWLNPPYSQPEISDFSKAVVEKKNEYEQILVLVNNATETEWLQNMLEIASGVCFIKRRIKFIDKSGNPTGSPLQGQVIIYIGNNPQPFFENFNELGICMKPHVEP